VLLAAAVHDLDASEQAHIDGLSGRKSAAHTDFAAGREGMIDGGNGAHARGAAQQGIHVGHGFSIETEIDKISAAEKVDVALESGELAAGNEQNLVEVGLQRAHGVVLRAGVVVGDGDEVKAVPRGGVDGEENRARNHCAGLARALPVAVGGVHVQIAAKPRGTGAQRLAQNFRLRGNGAAPGKENVNRIVRFNTGADVGDADEHVPRAGRDGAGQTGRRGVGKSHGEDGFVAAAPAAETGGIEQAEIECGVLLLTGVCKFDGDAPRAFGDVKWSLDVTMILRAAHHAGENHLTVFGGSGARGGSTALRGGNAEWKEERETKRGQKRCAAPAPALDHNWHPRGCRWTQRASEPAAPKTIVPHLSRSSQPSAGQARDVGRSIFKLIKQLEGQLECARSEVLVAVAGSGDAAETGAGEVQLTRLREGRRVGDVESFGAELEMNCFLDGKLLQNGGIQVGEMRTADLLNAAAERGVIHLPDSGGCGWLGEGAGVQPLGVVVGTAIEALAG
jgi:hypothetical protein